jgi:prepilin signal peptidase PulO-like enzyme (type II secretory pathway)
MNGKEKRKKIIGIGCMILVLVFLVVSAYFYQYEWTKILRNYVLSIALVWIAGIDRQEKRIPNRILAYLLLIRAVLLGAELFVYPDLRISLCSSVFLGMLFGGGVLLIAYAVSRGGIGMGDVKLFAVIGAYVGSRSIAACLLLSMLLAAVYSAVMLLRKKLTAKDEIPLGPFAAAGTIFSILIGA